MGSNGGRETVDVRALRRYVVAHQGFAASRRGTVERVAGVIEHLGAVQLDSITRVDRAHRLTIASRVGAVAPGTINQLLERRRVFEYWAHEACLVPMAHFPFMRRRMFELQDRHFWGSQRGDADIEADVLARLREEGPLPARAFEGRNTAGEMWGWKPSKRALEHLFAAGEVMIVRRDGFQRVYELTERVAPKHLLETPVMSSLEFVREYAAAAVHGRGALTVPGVIEHCRFKGRRPEVEQALDELVDEGRLRRVAVSDGGLDVYVPAGAELDGAPSGAVFLCPFENLLWDRAFAPRLFGFEHIIEVYKPEPQRRFGYYVLPLLVRDRIVGRADLTADRRDGVLRVGALHLEPKVRFSGALESATHRALVRVAAASRVTWDPDFPLPVVHA